MSSRNCPKCKDILGEYDYFFCSSCGVKLAKEAVREPHAIKVRTYLTYQEGDKFSLKVLVNFFKNKTVLSIGGLLFFIAVIIFGISNTGIIELVSFNVSKGPSVPEVKIPTRQQPVITLNTTYSEGTFDNNALVTYVPATVDFYVEGFDVDKLSEYLALDEDLAPFFSKSALLLEDNFVGYYSRVPEETWVYIFVPTDMDIAQKILEDVEDDYWNFRIVNDLIIISSKVAAFGEIDKVLSKLEPSLALNPEYVKRIQDLPKDGQFRIVFLNDEIKSILRNSLGGLDQVTIGDINTVLLSDFNGMVIK